MLFLPSYFKSTEDIQITSGTNFQKMFPINVAGNDRDVYDVRSKSV
jgi:hypothetical protein